jgi:hypothetical protein
MRLGGQQGDDEGRCMEATKRCSYCGEEILAVAIKCKHCRSSLDVASVSAPRLGPPAADLAWVILGIPLAAIVLMWAWVANLSLIQGPSSALSMIVASVVISTAAACALEASKLGMRADRRNGTYSPVEWGLSVLLLWFICFPTYLFKRRKFGVSNLLLPGLIVAAAFLGSTALLAAVIEGQKEKVRSSLRTLGLAFQPEATPAASFGTTRRAPTAPENAGPDAPSDDSAVAQVSPRSSSETDRKPSADGAIAQVSPRNGSETERKPDADAAKRSAAFCSEMLSGSYTLEAACRDQEAAAWRRLIKEFPNPDHKILRFCAEPPLGNSFYFLESCVRQETQAKTSLKKTN